MTCAPSSRRSGERTALTRVTGALALLVTAVAGAVMAATPIDTARALLLDYHEDLTRLERARDLLQAAAEREPTAEVLSTLALAWFLIGEFHARNDRERAPGGASACAR